MRKIQIVYLWKLIRFQTKHYSLQATKRVDIQNRQVANFKLVDIRIFVALLFF